MSGDPPRVFLSHIHEESPFATKLQDWIEGSFPERVSVFVSSDANSITPGSEWRERLDMALSEASAMVLLASPAALDRPWISFEAGCGWVNEIPVIPVCHSGLTKGTLPKPFSRFEALNLSEENFGEKLLAALSDHLDLGDVPRIDFNRMEEELRSAVESSTAPKATGGVSGGEEELQPDDLKDHHLAILKLLADKGSLAAIEIAGVLGVHKEKARHWCDQLDDADLVIYTQSFLAGQPATYSLSEDGRALLVRNDFL